jgi:hypothetical protein
MHVKVVAYAQCPARQCGKKPLRKGKDRKTPKGNILWFRLRWKGIALNGTYTLSASKVSVRIFERIILAVLYGKDNSSRRLEREKNEQDVIRS